MLRFPVFSCSLLGILFLFVGTVILWSILRLMYLARDLKVKFPFTSDPVILCLNVS